MVSDWVSSTDWGAPSYLFAAISAVICFLIPSKNVTRGKKKNFNARVLLAVVSSSGFFISGWFGILTFSIASTYLILNWFQRPKLYLYPALSLVIFFTLSTIVGRIDPEATQESREGNFGGVWGTVSDTVTLLGEKATEMLIFALLAGAIIAGVVFYVKRRRENVYRNLGLNLSREQMYNGLVNKDLRTIPEDQRDPKRSFPTQMRAKKLKEQKGVCAYAYIPSHPDWEPYRTGVQWEGDHIIPWAVGGATNLVNLQMLCADCNSAKSSKMFKEAEKSVDKMWKVKSKQRYS